MDKNGKGVNWSAVACRAFEVKLGEITTKRGAKEMKDVVQRLRGQKLEVENEDQQAGYDAGYKWASESADLRELKRLAKLRESLRNNFDDWFAGDHGHATVTTHVYECIRDEERADWDETRAFWVDELGVEESSIESVSFIQGFVEGALAVWDSVEGQI
jgi:hypothetical protein